MRHQTKRMLAASAAMILMPAAAEAQNAEPASPVVPADAPGTTAPQPAADAAAVEDIVVTASRRSADVQAVPITIQAVSATTLKAYNVTGVLQLPTLTSGLVVTPSGGNNIYLRGVGSASTGFNEAQTAVYIDGLYLANPALSIFSFNNIERIEVLKGPQGTLYGRNATAGLISVITREPGVAPRVDASASYANYDTLTLNLYASAPLTDTLAANIAIFHQKQGRGWSTNVFTGANSQKIDETGFEGKLVWRPGSGTKATLGLTYDYNNRTFGYAYEVYPGTLANDGTPYLGRYRYAARTDPDAPTHAYIATLKIEQDIGLANLTSLTGYQTSRANVRFTGGSPALGQPLAGQGVSTNQFYERNRTFSEELQLTSKPSSSRFDWVLGAFYYNDHTRLRLDTYTTCIGNVCTPNFTPTRNDGRPSTLSGSVFGDASYRFFAATHVTVGLRYTAERRTLAGLVSPLQGFPDSVAALPAAATATTAGTVFYPGQPFPGFPNGIPTRQVFHRLTYRFVLAQDIGENIHLFVSHNLGFKSGAFNGNAFNNPPARPELLYATEAGIKSELLDRRVRINASYFHYDYRDVQVRSMAPPAAPGNALLLNAARERMDGVDVDVSVVPTRGLTLNGAFEYLDARYVDFPGATCTSPTTVTVNGVVLGRVVNTPCNLAGQRPQFSPKVTATIGAVYNFETTLGSFTVSANDHYNSRTVTASTYVYNGAHHIVDVSLGWTSRDRHYDVQLWVKNLTDEYVYAVGQASTSFTIVPGAPRTFGATVGFHY